MRTPDKKKRVTQEREFVEVRRAALRVAAWEHKDDPEVAKIEEAIQKAEDNSDQAEKNRETAKQAVGLARQEMDKYLEQFIPEGLRKVEKE